MILALQCLTKTEWEMDTERYSLEGGRKGKLGALRPKWRREDGAVKYALLLLFSNIRRDAGAWP